jgi:hypothetical protein
MILSSGPIVKAIEELGTAIEIVGTLRAQNEANRQAFEQRKLKQLPPISLKPQ